MTPTREQVIEWAKAAGLSFDDGWIFYTPKRQSLPEAEFGAFVAAMNAAYSAGRLKGLEEAKGAALATRDLDEEKRARDRAMAARGGDMENEVRKLDHYFTVVAYNAGLNKCAAAIEQLKEQSK